VSDERMAKEERRARGIAAMGRVERDADGFTVYSTEPVPEAFRVWEDAHAGARCTCDEFDRAFLRGEEYSCEHILAVALALDPPEEAVAPTEPAKARPAPVRRVV
jgi:hypothetical protein